MKRFLLAVIVAWVATSCAKNEGPFYVYTSSYYEYVILKSGDTVTYSDGYVFGGINQGSTEVPLTKEQEQKLLKSMDSTCRTDGEYVRFRDKALIWQEKYPGQTLDYMMRFDGHQIREEFRNLTVEDVQTIRQSYHTTVMRISPYIVGGIYEPSMYQ